MPKTLAELRQSPHTGRPETLHTLCVAGKLNAAIDAIDAELDDLLHAEADKLQARQQPASDDPDAPKPPGRLGRPHGYQRQAQNPRIAELNLEREKLREEMREHTVTLRVRATEDGIWRAWRQAHPPREGDQADQRAGFNIDDLLDLIGSEPRTFIADVNGEAYTDDDWAFIWGAAAEGDKWRLAATVRLMHQGAVEVPKSLSSWLATPKPSSTSDSPES